MVQAMGNGAFVLVDGDARGLGFSGPLSSGSSGEQGEGEDEEAGPRAGAQLVGSPVGLVVDVPAFSVAVSQG